MLCLGNIGGSLITPFFYPTIGPKMTLLLISFPGCVLSVSLLLLFRTIPSVWMFYASRFIGGAAMSIMIGTVPPYIMDISSPERRGLLGLLVNMFFRLGTLLEFSAGALLDWWWISFFMLFLLLPFIVLFPFMPDSPTSLAARGRTRQAQEALQWLGRSDIKTTPGGDRQPPSGGLTKYQQMLALKEPANLFPFLLCLSFHSAAQLSGVAPLIFFSVQFFTAAAGSAINPSLSSIVVAAVQFITVIVCGLTVSNAPRRRLMLLTQAVITCCLFTIAGYFLLDEYGMADNIKWLPLVVLIIFFIFFNAGMSSLIWVITPELIPSKIRSFVYPCTILVGGIHFFVVSYMYNYMFQHLGGCGLFLFYASWSLFYLLVFLFFLPETKEKLPEQIEKFFLEYKIPFLK